MLRLWIENQEDKQYFASLFTLGTNDPLILPDFWELVYNLEYRETGDKIICLGEYTVKEKSNSFYQVTSLSD